MNQMANNETANNETVNNETAKGMRRILASLSKKTGAFYVAGDMFGRVNYLSYHFTRPVFRQFQANFEVLKAECVKLEERGEPFDFDVPWVIDLVTGEMEIPSMKLKLSLEEWASM